MKINRKYILKVLPIFGAAMLSCVATSCFKDDEPANEQYADWKELNEKYIESEAARTDANGKPYYTRIIPSWAPNTFVLVHWHNDRALTANNLRPMDNSTTKIKYELLNIDGQSMANSYANADSLYTSKPNSNIIGMWAALTNMNVGDSVTMVVPQQAGYGQYTHGDVKPYSTLIFNVKLQAITAYEIP